VIWNAEAECMPREQLQAVQLARLRSTLGRLLGSVPLMRERLNAVGVTSPEDVRSLDDLARLPFTRKADLRETYPFGLFAVPRAQLVRIHASSGTSGKPTVVGYTRADLAVWAEVTARTLAMGGVRPGMVLHNATGYGLFTGGLGFHAGAELMGCTVVPVGGGFTQRQVMLLLDFGAQAIKSTPSYALTIASELERMGLDASALRLEVGLFGAEPWSEGMRTQIERSLGLTAINDYGLSEIIGPGVSGECIEVRQGMHIQEDHFLAEIVDGELVLTSLTKEALPLLRYRTGDVSSLDYQPCACGRTFARMAPVPGRIDDMLIIRGVNLYPSEVERVLLGLPGTSPHYQLVVDRPDTLDELSVLCEPASSDLDADDLRRRAADALRQATGLTIRVEVRPVGSIPRSEGKAIRVVDRRK
jgi:phenylacetate-CoA ligase